MKRSSPPRRRTPLRSSGRPRTSNPTRKAREWKRAYGSDRRVAFIRALPCMACSAAGHSENAHVTSGGAGRKADARFVIPLCGPRVVDVAGGYFEEGCHYRLHAVGRETFERMYDVNLLDLAEVIDALYAAHVREQAL